MSGDNARPASEVTRVLHISEDVEAHREVIEA